MIGQGVDVIVASLAWGLHTDLGDGVPQSLTTTGTIEPSLLDIIKRATAAKILWVNAAGNENQRIWHGSFSDVTADNIHDYTRGDSRNYIELPTTPSRYVSVQMRWDDSWGSSGCDLDLYLYREARGRITPVSVGVDTQRGGASHIPYEVAGTPRIYPHSPTAEKYYVVIKRPIHGRLATTPDPCAKVDWVEIYTLAPNEFEHAETGYSIAFPGTSRAPGLLAVGAAPHYSTSAIASYSSRGPTHGRAD